MFQRWSMRDAEQDGAGEQQGQPILGLCSPHKMQPLLPASQRGSVHYPLQSAPRSRIKGAVTASSLIIIDYPF